MTKSGQRCGNPVRLEDLESWILVLKVQDASGDRRAPLGRRNPVEESAAMPRPSSSRPRIQLPANSRIARTGFKIGWGHDYDFALGCHFEE